MVVKPNRDYIEVIAVIKERIEKAFNYQQSRKDIVLIDLIDIEDECTELVQNCIQALYGPDQLGWAAVEFLTREYGTHVFRLCLKSQKYLEYIEQQRSVKFGR